MNKINMFFLPIEKFFLHLESVLLSIKIKRSINCLKRWIINARMNYIQSSLIKSLNEVPEEYSYHVDMLRKNHSHNGIGIDGVFYCDNLATKDFLFFREKRDFSSSLKSRISSEPIFDTLMSINLKKPLDIMNLCQCSDVVIQNGKIVKNIYQYGSGY